jgi:hypothetical protein
MPALAGNGRDPDGEEEIRGKGITAVQCTAHAIETPPVPRSEARRAGRATLERDRRGGVGLGWGSLAPRTTPGSTNSGIVIGIAGFLTLENWTSPLTGSPSGNSTSGAGSSAGRRNQEEQREKRGCEYRSHIVFREVGLTTTSRSYSPTSRLGHRHKTRFAHSQTQIEVGAGGGTLEERRRWGGPLCKKRQLASGCMASLSALERGKLDHQPKGEP